MLNENNELDKKIENYNPSDIDDVAKKLGVDAKNIIAAIDSLGDSKAAINNL